MKSRRNLPNQERLSIVVATILLAYTLAKIVNVPSRIFHLELIGIIIPISINFNSWITLAVSGMTASGADWLLRDHPRLENKSTLPHLLLPALSAWILSIILNTLPNNPMWWVAFAIGGTILLLVILAEYITLDEEDFRQPLAGASLNALSYATFLALAVSLRYSDLRLIVILPALAIASGIMSLRIIQLQNPDHQTISKSLLSLIIVSQLAAALHYLPFTPLSFGLFLLGTLYATTNFISNLSPDGITSRVVAESIFSLLILWGMAFWLN